MDLYKKILELDSVYEGEGQQPGGFTTNNPNEAIKEIVRRMFPGVNATIPISENLQLNLGPGVNEISAGGQFDVGGGQFTIGGGMSGDDKAFGIGFRKEFNEGSVPVPKYPDLRMFPPVPNEAQAKEKAKVLKKFQSDLKKYLLKEIKNFKKDALPNEKYQLIENNILRAIGYKPEKGKKAPKSITKYIKEVIAELPKDGSWELNKTGKGQFASGAEKKGTPIPENIKNQLKPFFRKNYKNLSISQMAERLTGQISGSNLHAAVKEALNRYKNFLIEKKVIKSTDVQRGMGGAEGVKKLPPKAYEDYRKETMELAKKAGLTEDPRFIATRGKFKGEFGYWKFDDYMKNTMLNMDKIRRVLGPNFPTMLLPSFEHIMGVKPGLITGDTSALKKVELQTKKYNFGAIDGMGARSADFRRVQNNLKSAVKELKDGNLEAANKSLAKVNQIYDNVAEKFNLNRNGLPKYNVRNNAVLETNLKQVSKAEKPNVSMFNFFEKVANQASEKEMKVIKDPRKVDPRVAKVITKFQSGDTRGIQRILASLSNNPVCAVFAGKRVKKSDGSPNANLDECVKGGIDAINSGKVPKDKATDFVKILKGGGTAVRNVVKFGVLPEALFVTADSLIRVGMGDTFKEAGLRASDYLLPGDQTKAADVSKVSRIFGDKTGEIVGKSIDYKNTINRINSLEAQKQNLEALDVPSDFDYFNTASSIKNIDSSISQAKKDLDTKFFMPLEQRLFADRKFDEAYDVSKAKAALTKGLGTVRETAEGMKDLDDISGLQSDAQAPTPLKLDTTMFPSFRKDMQAATEAGNISEDDIRRYFESIGQSPDKFLQERESFMNLKKLPISTLAQIYGDEQLYGTQGASALGEPLANGGIAGLSGGDKSGPPPERGPDSEGLRSLMKRGINL